MARTTRTHRKPGPKKTGRKARERPEHDALVARLAEALRRRRGVTLRRMFGGTCFLVNGNMACGVTGDGTLMVRVGPDAHAATLKLEGARPMDFTGRPLKGMVYVDAAALRRAADLKSWADRGVAFARSLPAK